MSGPAVASAPEAEEEAVPPPGVLPCGVPPLEVPPLGVPPVGVPVPLLGAPPPLGVPSNPVSTTRSQ